jgi:hypothetical protein
MEANETSADGYIPLEYEDAWNEERHFVVRLRDEPRGMRQRRSAGARSWKRKL